MRIAWLASLFPPRGKPPMIAESAPVAPPTQDFYARITIVNQRRHFAVYHGAGLVSGGTRPQDRAFAARVYGAVVGRGYAARIDAGVTRFVAP